MRVLVIGGTEFVSLHLVRALIRDGHEVVVLNRGRRRERLPAGVRTIICDRTDHAALRATLVGERVDALVDVAYAPTTGADVEAALEALAGRLGHALLVSTGRVYDHSLPIPYSEDTPRGLYWGEYAKNKIAGEEAVTQVGLVELIADVIKRPLTLVHIETRPGATPVPLGQNLVYDCHAVYTTTKVRSQLGIRPRYTLAAGLAQTFEWYLYLGLDRRELDFSAEDMLLK